MKALKSALLVALVLGLALGFAQAQGCDCGDDDDDRSGAVIADDDADDEVYDAGDDNGCGNDTGSTWTDSSSGYMWPVNPTGEASNWEDAKTHCEEICIGGYTDWRLPSVSELRSLIQGCDSTEIGGSCSITDDCLYTYCDDGGCNGCFDGEGPTDGCYWPAEMSGNCAIGHWSSSIVTDYDTVSWFVLFDAGRIVRPCTSTMRSETVRCVR